MRYLQSVHSEWLKTKRSASFWLSLVGGFFIPLIVLISQLKGHSSLVEVKGDINPWIIYFNGLWSTMVTFLMPMGMILASSLITHLEFKNNTWKQLHTTPQSYTSIYLAKFTVIILMVLLFFVFFNLGILLSASIPCWIFANHLPPQGIPWSHFFIENGKYFISCLPILAVHFAISLQLKNVIVPIGIGLLGLIGTLIAQSWKYVFISPYAYAPLNYLKDKQAALGINIHWAGIIYFLIVFSISYFLYIRKKEKG